MPDFYCWEHTYGEENAETVCRKISAEKAFPFLYEKKHVISLVGAGGKTTLLFWMAHVCADRGMRVLVTTSTHILKPQDGSFAEDMLQVQKQWAQGKYAVIGNDSDQGKLSIPKPDFLSEAMQQADMVLIEADGSRRLPCKAPGDREPVLLPESDIVVGVLGLSSLGKPVGEICFRPERVLQICGQGMSMSRMVTESDLAKLFASARGLQKLLNGRAFYPVINQCDDEEKLLQAGKIAVELEQVVITEMEQSEEQSITAEKKQSVESLATAKLEQLSDKKPDIVRSRLSENQKKQLSLIGSCFQQL